MDRLASTIGCIVVLSSCGGGAGGGSGFPPDYPGSEAAHERTSAAGEPAGDAFGDELTLVYQDAQSACFDGLFRAAFRDDGRLSAATITCTEDDSHATASVTAEMVSVYDYGEGGDLEDVVTEDITSDAYAEASLAPPEPPATRVVERRARICCEIAASDHLQVQVNGAGGGSLTFDFDGT